MGNVGKRCRPLSPQAIIIMGVSGSGKSTVGDEIARVTDCPFLEGDIFHAAESIAKMRAGEPLSDADRWPWLDRVGEAVNTAMAANSLVFAACSALKKSYRDRLRNAIHGPVRFVLLDGERHELRRRLRCRTGHFMPATLLDSQIETLERPHADEQALTLDAQLSPAVLADRIFAWLNQS